MFVFDEKLSILMVKAIFRQRNTIKYLNYNKLH
jgi:hypothetical protein